MQKMKKDRKVTFLDSKVLQKFSEIVAIIATAATLFSVFVTIPELYKFYFGMFFFARVVLHISSDMDSC